MSDGARLLRGVFRGGVVVPEPGCELPDGTAVEFEAVRPLAFTPDERAEFAGWETIGDEAWAMIDEWERENGHAPG